MNVLLFGVRCFVKGLLYPVDLSTSLPNSSETATATGVWLLRVSVDTTTGVLFEVKGTSSGGDCDEVCRCC